MPQPRCRPREEDGVRSLCLVGGDPGHPFQHRPVQAQIGQRAVGQARHFGQGAAIETPAGPGLPSRGKALPHRSQRCLARQARVGHRRHRSAHPSVRFLQSKLSDFCSCTIVLAAMQLCAKDMGYLHLFRARRPAFRRPAGRPAIGSGVLPKTASTGGARGRCPARFRAKSVRQGAGARSLDSESPLIHVLQWRMQGPSCR